MRLHWPTAYPGFHLQGVGRFTSAQPYPFTNVTAVPVELSDRYGMTNTHSRTNNGFFRLRKP